MPEIAFKDLKSRLRSEAKDLPPVFLVYGHDFLRDQAVDRLMKTILPDRGSWKHHHEVVTAKDEGHIVDVIERMNTYAFFSGRKVVELRDDGLFSSRQTSVRQSLGKIKNTYESDFDRAVQFFLEMLGRMRVELKDLKDEHSAARLLNLTDDQLSDIPLIRGLVRYCLENHLEIPQVESAGEGAELLKGAIEKGFPKNHHLIIVSDAVDKRTALYKRITDRGCIIDCSVASGTRKADRDEQLTILNQFMQAVLKKSGKTAHPQAFELMVDLTGFDMRTFAANLEKLVAYTDDRMQITAADVRSVLSRTREDPVYELTGAVSEKNAVRALYFLNSLLQAGYHPLQILSALTNQMRRLLLIKEFITGPEGHVWQPGMNFTQFKNMVMPAVRAYDEQMIRAPEGPPSAPAASGKSGARSGAKSATDLLIARQPNNPYPVYQMFLRSDNFSLKALCASFKLLSDADRKLKQSVQTPRFVLEAVILEICRNADSRPST